MEIEIEKYNEIKNRRKNLMSFVIFKMIGPYRSFDKYINYLKNLINNFYDKAKNEDFDMRVYFDNSCKNDIKPLIEKYKYIEFYKYNYQPLRIGEFHNGTFGSIIRLLPIFKKDDISYKYVWLDDIDITNLDFTLMNIFKNKSINTLTSSMFCYSKPWTNNKYNLNFPIITDIKLDINILNKYLNDIVNNKYKDVIDKILTYRNDRYKYDYDIKFPYGMDEYFTNNIIYKDLTKNAYTIYDYNITRMLKKILLSNIIKDKRNNEIINELLKLNDILWKTNNLKIKNEIINTYMKLINKIGLKALKEYFSLIDENDCLDQYYNFIETIELKTIISFQKIIPII